ncbi:MAG: class II glutamine amidotransferase [Burkholderiales bacterium]|nr:class II glutamine amidotransferase [Burkholderiales bacterium]
MCQLLGMNCNVPTDICFSFQGFSQRGGLTDTHKDGWGIGFFEGAGCRVFIDSKATIDSPLAEFIKTYPIRSMNVIAHIRRATQGAVALANCHPFVRELWGQYWVFAHNGDLQGFYPRLDGHYRPVGATDSERAFCYLLEHLRNEFSAAPINSTRLYPLLKRLADEVRTYGRFNFLLSNGEVLYAYCSDHLYYVLRRSPFTTAHLVDQDVTVDFSTFAGPDDKVAVIATQPLTDNEEWVTMAPGELVGFHMGEPILGVAQSVAKVASM